jgi:TonB family protein
MRAGKEKSMTVRRQVLLSAAFAVFLNLPGTAREVKVIANPSVGVESISVAELKGIFLLQRKALKDGNSVEPVLQKSGPTHDAFLHQYLNRDSEEIRIYYQGLVFTGKGSMPKQLESDADVVAYVARTRGAIGYIGSTSPTEGVRVITVNAGDTIRERALLSRVEPEYPETLKRMGIGGTVRLQLVVSPKGTVDSVVVRGGNPILGEAAAKAAKQWIYAVATNQTTIDVTIPFAP